MGYYIEVPQSKGKAQQLVALHNAKIAACLTSLDEVPDDQALICIVDNGPFEAAGYCYSQQELDDFSSFDGRFKQWVLMDKALAEKLSGYKE